MNDKPELKVITLRETTLRDAPAKLRDIANAIENGEHGQIGCIGIVVFGNTLEIYGLCDGVTGDGLAPSVATLFRAACWKLEKDLAEHGR